MCGIFCILTSSEGIDCRDLLKNFEIFKNNILNRGPNYLGTEIVQLSNTNVLLTSSVLWLQGQEITKQPLKNEQSVFIYNGDIFGGLFTDDLRGERGDTQLLYELLQSSEDFSTALCDINGPYAFIYLDKVKEKIFFGRDIYGRRSLLIGKSNDDIVITSVAKRKTDFNFIELPSIGIFCIDLKTQNMKLFPWKRKNQNFTTKLEEVESFLNKTAIIIDKTACITSKKFVEPTSDDLRIFQAISKFDDSKIFDFLLRNDNWKSKVDELQCLLENGVNKRISTQPNFCQNCYKMDDCAHCLNGVLFSGGIDCAILALLTDKFTDKRRAIDLINVAFDRVKDYKTPDRITALETLQELKRLAPERHWNFVEVNVTQQELDLARSEIIADLIYPLNSILDDSLGCALWFASRGQSEDYKSPCRVLLVGMGADELFGGYTRHRAALQKSGWSGLHKVLDEDWQNLSHRNLARDDRVVSDHGRQLRTPYLDENVVEFVRSLNSWEKTCPSRDLSQGIGEKILLRSLGHKLGLKNAACFKKRALQFGSRIANKNENAHEVSTRLINNI